MCDDIFEANSPYEKDLIVYVQNSNFDPEPIGLNRSKDGAMSNLLIICYD